MLWNGIVIILMVWQRPILGDGIRITIINNKMERTVRALCCFFLLFSFFLFFLWRLIATMSPFSDASAIPPLAFIHCTPTLDGCTDGCTDGWMHPRLFFLLSVPFAFRVTVLFKIPKNPRDPTHSRILEVHKCTCQDCPKIPKIHKLRRRQRSQRSQRSTN